MDDTFHLIGFCQGKIMSCPNNREMQYLHYTVCVILSVPIEQAILVINRLKFNTDKWFYSWKIDHNLNIINIKIKLIIIHENSE